EALNEPVETDGTDRPAALGNEYVGVCRVIAAQLTKRPHLVTADWVYAGNAALDAVNVQAALGELDLLPLQVADLGGPQAMAVGHQDHGRIPMPVTAMLAGVVHQPLDFALGEIASFNCQVYDVWSALLGSRFHRGKTFLFDIEWLAYTLFLHSRKGRSGRMHRDRWRHRSGREHGGAGREANLIFVLPPNVYVGPPPP